MVIFAITGASIDGNDGVPYSGVSFTAAAAGAQRSGSAQSAASAPRR